MRCSIENLIIDGVLFGNPVLLMALDREDEIVYRLAGLVRDIPYRPVRMIVREETTMPGRPDEESRLIRTTANACRGMLNRTDHPFTMEDGRQYAARLGIPTPEVLGGQADAFDLLRSLWDANPILAAVCCNHRLIHDRRGIFAPERGLLPLFEDVLANGDRETFEDAFIRRIPGMMSVRRERRLLADA
ncbi:hypothetical protein [Bifidobacterium sp. SO1]|uniref:hypothetical protein n=1 Tax=Bifidobacterium sp. SO1 TaxID=2809029 RepID=UPI001BDDB07B|nr:hypothetical protein [Bifidobacterium sp. SO1]MBT1162775.1 hypothetical protein [Bifidobacterium sp. SO1]